MAKLSRNKGAAWEREVARLFKGRRTAPMQAGHAREYGDVIAGNFVIECKCGKHTSWRDADALEQAIIATHGNDSLIPIAVCKEDYRSPYVVILIADLAKTALGIHIPPDSPLLYTRVRVDLGDFLDWVVEGIDV
jgi:hypothetical protein